MKEKHEHSQGQEVDRRVAADKVAVGRTIGIGLVEDTAVGVRYSLAAENAEVQGSMVADTYYFAEDTVAEMGVAAVLAIEVAGRVAAVMHLAAVGSPDLADRVGKAAEVSMAVAQIQTVVGWERHPVEVGEDMVTQVLVQASVQLADQKLGARICSCCDILDPINCVMDDMVLCANDVSMSSMLRVGSVRDTPRETKELKQQ